MIWSLRPVSGYLVELFKPLLEQISLLNFPSHFVFRCPVIQAGQAADVK
jgi:hypothetical protein